LACRRAPDQDGDRIALLAHNFTDLYEIMFACRTEANSCENRGMSGYGMTLVAQSGHSAKLPTSAFQVRALCAQQSFSRIYRSTWLSDFRRRNDLAPQKLSRCSSSDRSVFAAFLAESFFPFL
jgi:hypothetical protein